MPLVGKGVKDLVLNGVIEIDKPNTDVKINGTLTLQSYTTTERNALTGVEGMIIFNSTTSKLNFYNGVASESLTSA